MGEKIETIKVKKLNNGKFMITRTMEDLVDFEELTKIQGEIRKAIIDTKNEIDELPRQMEVKKILLTKQLDVMNKRLSAFEPHMPKSKKIDE